MGPIEIITIIAVVIGIPLTYFLRYKRLKPGWDRWTIKKGRHFSRKNDSLFLYKFGFAKKSFRFQAYFADGCNYVDNSDGDVNKLYGVSYGLDNHKKSVRIGWKHNGDNTIDLYAYYYVDGVRNINCLMSVSMHEVIEFDILKSGSSVHIRTVNGRRSQNFLIRNIGGKWPMLKEYPYYGGDQKAPNDMTIYIKQL
jgi:hypothetical protein